MATLSKLYKRGSKKNVAAAPRHGKLRSELSAHPSSGVSARAGSNDSRVQFATFSELYKRRRTKTSRRLHGRCTASCAASPKESGASGRNR